MSRKPKRQDSRRHRHKNFNYLLKKTKKNNNRRKSNKMNQITTHTVHGTNGKSIIRNTQEVFKPLVFADFNYLLEGKHSLTDIDGQLEINGNIFIVESKSHYSSINGGQLVSLFHSAYNTWKRGKVGQLTYLVHTGRLEKGVELVDYVVFGTQQFKQYEAGIEVIPYIELNQSIEWLASRLKAFQEVCYKNHDKDIQINNRHLFGAVETIKNQLKTRGKLLPF